MHPVHVCKNFVYLLSTGKSSYNHNRSKQHLWGVYKMPLFAKWTARLLNGYLKFILFLKIHGRE